MPRNTEEYSGSRYDDDDEDLTWKSTKETAYWCLKEIDQNHPELLKELLTFTRDHGSVSWMAQDPVKDPAKDGQSAQYPGQELTQIDPESTTGKIFLSFQKATWEIPEESRWEPARDMAEHLLRPLEHAAREIEEVNPDTRAYPVYTTEQTIHPRIRNLTYNISGALATGNEEYLLMDIKEMQWVSRDLQQLESGEPRAADFNQRMNAEHPDLQAEMEQMRKIPRGEGAPTWLRENGAEASDHIYRIFEETMESESPEFRRMASYSLADVMIHAADHADINDEIVVQEKALQTALLNGDKGRYDQTLERLRDRP